jgi:hypothetical protein
MYDKTRPVMCWFYGSGNVLHLKQAFQTQITVRAAHWVLKVEKLTAGDGLDELHMTLYVNFRHILANFILKWTKISHIS